MAKIDLSYLPEEYRKKYEVKETKDFRKTVDKIRVMVDNRIKGLEELRGKGLLSDQEIDRLINNYKEGIAKFDEDKGD